MPPLSATHFLVEHFNHCDPPSLRVSRDHGPLAFLPIQIVLKSIRDLDRDRDTLRSHTWRSQGEPGWTKVGPETLLPRPAHNGREA